MWAVLAEVGRGKLWVRSMYAQFVKKEIDKNHLSGRMTTKKYFKNCFLLLIPIFIWNLLLYSQLPVGYQSENFDKDIPTLLS